MAANLMRSVLVVDDDETFARSVAQLLHDEDFMVRTANDAAKALAEVDRERPDLVLCDVLMPQVTGWDLAERLIDRGDRIPLVLMSGVSLERRGATLGFVRKRDGVDKILAAVNGVFAAAAA